MGEGALIDSVPFVGNASNPLDRAGHQLIVLQNPGHVDHGDFFFKASLVSLVKKERVDAQSLELFFNTQCEDAVSADVFSSQKKLEPTERKQSTVHFF